MKGLEGGHKIDPNIARDPNVRESVFGQIDLVLQGARFEKMIARTFGVSALELSETEKERYKLFTRHALRRQVLSFISGRNGFDRNTEQKTQRLLGEDLIYHDVAHSIVSVEDEQDRNSIVPYFIGRTAEELMNNKRALVDEIRALLWFDLLGDTASFLSLCQRSRGEEFFAQGFLYHDESVIFDKEWTKVRDMFRKVTPGDFKGLLEVYIRAMFANLRRLNDDYIASIAKTTEEESQFSHKYDMIIEEVLQKPHPLLVKNAQYIFDHKNDPKVLYNLFENICSKYVDDLEKRKGD